VRGLGGITGLVTVARCTSTDMDDLCAAKVRHYRMSRISATQWAQALLGASRHLLLQAVASPCCMCMVWRALEPAWVVPGQCQDSSSLKGRVCLLQKAIITLMFLAEESDLNREAIAKAGAADAIAETVDYFAARKAQLCMQYGHIAPTAEAALAKLQDLSELMASCEVLD